MLQNFVSYIQIKIQFADVLRHKFRCFQFKGHEALQFSMIEQKVDVEIHTTHRYFKFLVHKNKVFAQFKNKGFYFMNKGFLQITLPTSPSVYDATNVFAADSRGRGFFALGTGMIFTKIFGKWDTNASGELHRSFARSFDSDGAGGAVTVTPGWGHSITIGGGWSYGDFRLGSSLSSMYEDGYRVRGAQDSDGSSQQNMTWSVIANYMLGMESAITLSYADQTIFGSPENSNLSKTVTLSYQQRWQR